MNKIHVKTLILGATYAGIGYAVANPASLILEANELVGADYAMTYRPVLSDYQSETEPGRRLEAFLKDRQVLCDRKGLDRLRLTTAIARYVDSKNLRMLLDVALLEMKRRDDGVYLVQTYTNNGVRYIQAEQVLDTTGERISEHDQGAIREKVLNVICSDCKRSTLEGLEQLHPDVEIVPGYLEGEWTVRFAFPPHTTIIEARQTIEDLWVEAFGGQSILIDSIAFDFEVRMQDPMSTTGVCPWLAPERFQHPLEAFDAGFNATLSDMTQHPSRNEVYDAIL